MDPSDLNPAQARVQKIKDELRTLDIDHLHSFLEGITDPEPPNYQKVTGVVKPPPAKVTLKESATTYKVGNVEFEDEIHAISLVVKDGVVEVKFDDALPRDSGNSLCFPIHDAVLLDLIPLWEVKYKAIKHRMAQINDVRAYAYNCPNQPEPRLKYGKNATNLMNTGKTTSTCRKRENGDAVSRHMANKRKKVGLDSIPDSTKSQVFERLPKELKVNLFNAVANTAFPNFDNIVMAAWNVVSMYEQVGTNSGQLNILISELRSVLTEFDTNFKKGGTVGNGVKKEVPDKAKKSLPKKESAPGQAALLAQTLAEIRVGAQQSFLTVSANRSQNPPEGDSESREKNGLTKGNPPQSGSNSTQGPPTRPESPQSLFVEEDEDRPSGRSHSQSPMMLSEVVSTDRTITDDNSTEVEPNSRPASRISHIRELRDSVPLDVSSEDERKREFKAQIRAARGQLQNLKSNSGLKSAGRINTASADERKGRALSGGRRDSDSSLTQRVIGEDGASDESRVGVPGSQNKNVHLGNSKLGRPRSGLGGPAPEAPMMHTSANGNRSTNGP